MTQINNQTTENNVGPYMRALLAVDRAAGRMRMTRLRLCDEVHRIFVLKGLYT